MNTFILYICCFLSLIAAAPVMEQPEKRQIITRYHTAAAVTTTDFYSTTTEIVTAPTVEYFISNDVTYTFTLTGHTEYPQPTTFTTVFKAASVAGQNNNNANLASAILGSSSTDSFSVSAGDSVTSTSTIANPPATSAPAPAPAPAPTATQPAAPAPAPAPTTTQPAAPAPTAGSDGTTTLSPQNPPNQGPAPPPATTPAQNQAPSSTLIPTSAVTQPAAPAQVLTTNTQALSIPPTVSTQTLNSATFTPASVAPNPVGQLTAAPSAIVYSPYNNDGSCKNVGQVQGDLALIRSKGISNIRIYGTDCNSLQTILPNAAILGMKVNQGLWISDAGVESIDGAINDLIAYGQQNGWGIFDFITVGNEAIISGFCSPSDLINKIHSVRGQLQAAGYNGPITTSEPPVSFTNHPELCTASGIDFVGINPHPYFDTFSSAQTAGSFLQGQVQLTKQVCNNMAVMVTETGYPSRGNVNGGNVPSKQNQLIAVQNEIDALNGFVTVLTTYDDFWKQPGPFGIEQSFGIIDLLPTVN